MAYSMMLAHATRLNACRYSVPARAKNAQAHRKARCRDLCESGIFALAGNCHSASGLPLIAGVVRNHRS
jgi:hypothetical protein